MTLTAEPMTATRPGRRRWWEPLEFVVPQLGQHHVP